MTNWLVAVASGERLPWPAPEGVRPSPFIRIKNFLDAAQQERLLAVTYADPKTFIPARIYSDKKLQLRRERRNALHADRSVIREIRRWFVPKLRCLVPRLAAHFHNGEPGKRFIEVEVTAYLTGGLFRPHSDSVDSADPPLGSALERSATLTISIKNPGDSTAATCCCTTPVRNQGAFAAPSVRA